jgi:hypothetical protein
VVARAPAVRRRAIAAGVAAAADHAQGSSTLRCWHSGPSAPWHDAGNGLHVSVPLACDGSAMRIPQQVHLLSQYSSGPHVCAPHGSGARAGAASAGPAPAWSRTGCRVPHPPTSIMIAIDPRHPRMPRS